MSEPTPEDPEPREERPPHPEEAPAAQGAAPATVEQVRFVRDLYARTPRLHVTLAIIAANVAVYLAMVLSGVHPLSPTTGQMLAWGADTPELTLDGEPWRLFTSMFLHFGIVHLAFNLWVLWALAQLVERALGHVGFLILYVGSGVIASEVSLVFHPFGVSAGASGAVFGVLGALLALLLRARDRIPPAAFLQLRRTVVSYLVLNLVIGAAVPVINMAAHTGGLVAGLLLGVLLVPPAAPVLSRGTRLVLAGAATAALSVAGFWVQPVPFASIQAEYDHANATWEESRRRYNDGIEALNDGSLDEAQLAELIRGEVLPTWRATCERLDAYGPVPGPLLDSFDDLRAFSRLQERALELQATALENPGDEDAQLRARAAWRKLDRASDAYRDGE